MTLLVRTRFADNAQVRLDFGRNTECVRGSGVDRRQRLSCDRENKENRQVRTYSIILQASGLEEIPAYKSDII